MPARPETLRAAIGGGMTLFGRHHTVRLSAMDRMLDADLTGAHVLLRTRDLSCVFQLFEYVWSQNIHRSTRTIYYFDILASIPGDATLIDRVLKDYVS